MGVHGFKDNFEKEETYTKSELYTKDIQWDKKTYTVTDSAGVQADLTIYFYRVGRIGTIWFNVTALNTFTVNDTDLGFVRFEVDMPIQYKPLLSYEINLESNLCTLSLTINPSYNQGKLVFDFSNDGETSSSHYLFTYSTWGYICSNE